MKRTVDSQKPDAHDLKNEEKLRQAVREGYAKIAAGGGSCCCGPGRVQVISFKAGYTEGELGVVPEGANLGLGCGNPIALASLKDGETVLDLGSGPGLDCFLAAAKVGPEGKVIGVDMTPAMVEKARANARQGGYNNVEFRLGEIENLPVADNSVDVVISNCVINLSPDKKRVFKETFRVLKPDGRVMFADIALLQELPDFIKNSVDAYIGCLSGAIMKHQYLAAMEAAGFKDVNIVDETPFPIDCMTDDPTAKAVTDDMSITNDQLKGVADAVVSIKVAAVKPGQD